MKTSKRRLHRALVLKALAARAEDEALDREAAVAISECWRALDEISQLMAERETTGALQKQLAGLQADIMKMHAADAAGAARRTEDQAAFIAKQAGAGPLPNRPAAELAATLVRETEWALEYAAGTEAHDEHDRP